MVVLPRHVICVLGPWSNFGQIEKIVAVCGDDFTLDDAFFFNPCGYNRPTIPQSASRQLVKASAQFAGDDAGLAVADGAAVDFHDRDHFGGAAG